MGLGVLDDRRLEHVPGTATVIEQTGPESSSPDTSVKYDATGTIILVPQPSDDPDDPLNWPLWRRDFILFVLSLLSVIATTLSPILAANSLTLSLNLGTDFTAVALLTGYHLLGVGLAGFVFVPSARVWGKRHLYLLGCTILVFSSAWAGASGKSYRSLLWARIFQGVGLAPFEALVNATVGDLYHVHQRGKRMAVTNLALFGGAFFTPVVVGKMTHELGWPWTFYFVAIFSGMLLPAVIFLVPETAFRRDQVWETDTSTRNRTVGEARRLETGRSSPVHLGSQSRELEKSAPASASPSTTGLRDAEHPYGSSGETQKGTYWQTLMPFNGRKTDEGYLRLLLRPFPLFLHPGILWACLIQGCLIGWTVLIGVVLAAIMLGPPLWFDEVDTGYMYTGAFVGALLGFILSGLLSDWGATLMTRWNKGVYEPEFRLILVLPQMVVGCAGLWGFGVTAANTTRYGWFWPDFFFGCEVMGMVLGAVASALYVVDAHRDLAVEAFTCMLVFKNMFSFGLTWSGYDWLVEHGIARIFKVVFGVQLAVCLLTIPLYILGKRNRSFFARHNVFFRLSDAVADWPFRFLAQKPRSSHDTK